MSRKRWATMAVLTGLCLGAFSLVYFPVPPADAPSVLVSVDRTLWNRSGFNRLTHVRALRDAGLRPVLVDFAAVTDPEAAADELLEGIDGLVIAGGGDVAPSLYRSDFDAAVDVNPRRDRFELALLRAAEQRSLPVLGLCRGAQLINVQRGGTLGDFRADSPRYDRHYRVMSGHPIDVEADIEVATDADFGVIGVQWHAEVFPWDAHQGRLFHAFADAASAYRSSRMPGRN